MSQVTCCGEVYISFHRRSEFLKIFLSGSFLSFKDIFCKFLHYLVYVGNKLDVLVIDAHKGFD